MMYLGMDETGEPVREFEAGASAGKEADGSARAREVKLMRCGLRRAYADGRKLAERQPRSVSYTWTVESTASATRTPNPRLWLPVCSARRCGTASTAPVAKW